MKTILALVMGVTVASGWTYAATAPGLTQSVSGGGVTVKVTYLKDATDELRFSVALDTHSVNLDAYDLKTLSFLRDNSGAVMQPSLVENKGSGHHREVILVFLRPSGMKWLEVVIKDIGGVKERAFRWDGK